MPKMKKTVKTFKRSVPSSAGSPATTDQCADGTCVGCCSTKKNPVVPILIVLAIIIITVLAINKGMILAAVVNGRPIFRLELSNTLMNRYGKQALENIISERLIAQEAGKKGMVVPQKDVDAKEEEILKSFGGSVTLEDFLKYQGMTKSDFDNQVKIQIMVSKLLETEIQITQTDVDDYIANNKASLVASEEGAMQEEAKQVLMDQKINEKIQPWFTELKAKAKILKFL